MGLATVNCIVALAVTLAIGFFVVLRAPRERPNRVFFFIAMAIAATAAGELVMRMADSPGWIMFGAKFGAAGWLFLGALFVHFALALSGNDRRLKDWRTYLLVYAWPAVLLALAWFTGLVYRGFEDAGQGFKEIEGPLRYVAAMQVAVLFVIGIVIVWRYRRRAQEKSEREDALYVLVSAVFLLLYGLVTDVVLIYTHKQNPPINILTASTVMALVLAYAVTRHGFMSPLSAMMKGTVLSIMMDPVLVLDSSGRIENTNEAMCGLSGTPEKEIKRRSLAELVRCGEGEPDLLKRLENGSSATCAGIVLDAGGEEVPVTISYGVVHSRSGRKMGSVVVLHDMRDVMEKARAQEQAKIALVEADAERRNASVLRYVIDVASHELRTPAAVFKGYATILQDSYEVLDRETLQLALSSMNSAADRVAHLSNSLLDASDLERGPIELYRAGVAPFSTVSEAVDLMRVQCPGYLFSISGGEEDLIEADPDRLRSVLVLLLENAVKFSPEGSEVRAWSDQDDSATTFHVADSGTGVPEEHREKIFGKFYQVEGAIHHSLPGLGLGLYIARRIVEAHGGVIWMDPSEGGGSVFRFSIPRCPGA